MITEAVVCLWDFLAPKIKEIKRNINKIKRLPPHDFGKIFVEYCDEYGRRGISSYNFEVFTLGISFICLFTYFTVIFHLFVHEFLEKTFM